MNRRLYRCTHDRRIAGVAAGVAEYLDLDPTIVRLLWVLSVFFGGLGLLLYFVMALVVPAEPEGYSGEAEAGWHRADRSSQAGESAGDASAGLGPAAGTAGPGLALHRHATRGGSGMGLTFFGAILILFGALALADNALPAWADQGRFLWPAFILGLGVLLVVTATRPRHGQL